LKIITDYIGKELEEGVFKPNEVHEYRFPIGESYCDAVYDPKNSRLKLYGITGRQFSQSENALSLKSPVEFSKAYTKLTIYAYPGEDDIWEQAGFTCEGKILGYFADSTDAILWVAYLDEERAQFHLSEENDAKLKIARSKQVVEPMLAVGYTCPLATFTDSSDISILLKRTFEDYPSPTEEGHIHQLIATQSNLFRYVRNRNGEMVAVASAEIDHKRKSAELTDCATLPSERGKGHMSYILKRLEEDLDMGLGITDVYSLARTGELGINCSFAKLGYVYTGRLRNNCRMPGGWESMNIWCKPDKQ